MSCSHPLLAWYSATVNPSGRRSLVFDRNKAFSPVPVRVSCGKCMRCRLERAYKWSARIVHEASLYDDNIFVTLTYDDDNLPDNNSLSLTDFQLFMKRLRKYSVSRRGRSFKFYMCGEYGERFGRPHYHAILFDFDFKDKKFIRKAGDYPAYVSADLSRIWSKGLCEIGSVTQDSAVYVSSYCTKVIRGPMAEAHYGGRRPEFSNCSNGIGRAWLERFHRDVYNYDGVVLKGGKVMRPPRYYDQKYELLYPNEAATVLAARKRWKRRRDDSFFRFCAREEITRAMLAQKTGSL